VDAIVLSTQYTHCHAGLSQAPAGAGSKRRGCAGVQIFAPPHFPWAVSPLHVQCEVGLVIAGEYCRLDLRKAREMLFSSTAQEEVSSGSERVGHSTIRSILTRLR